MYEIKRMKGFKWSCLKPTSFFKFNIVWILSHDHMRLTLDELHDVCRACSRRRSVYLSSQQCEELFFISFLYVLLSIFTLQM